MNTPQEVKVWFILPALRREFAISLKKIGLRQKEIANVLNITEPAVSQYFKKKRGSDVIFPLELSSEISQAALRIREDNSIMLFELQRMFKKMHDQKFTCKVCNDHIQTEPSCEICYR